MYSQIIRDSGKDLLHHKRLYIPHLISLGLYVAMFVLLAMQFVIVAASGIDFADFTSIKPIVYVLGAIFLVMDIILVICISAWTRSMSIGLLNDVAHGRKMGNMMQYGKKNFKRYFGYIIIVALLQLVPLLALAGISVLMLLKNLGIGIIVTTISIIIMYYWGVILTFGVFFIEPVLVSEQKSWQAFKTAIAYSKKEHRNMFMVYGILALVSLIVQLAINIVLGTVLMPLYITGVLAGLGYFIEIVVKFAVAVVALVFANLIIFRAFKSKIEFPHNAGFASRALAMYLDFIMLIPIFIGTAGIIAYHLAGTSMSSFSDVIEPLLNIALPIIVGLLILDFLYFTIPVAIFGGTPGKLFLGLRIVDEKKQKITIFRAILRYFCYILAVIPGFTGFIWIIIDDKNRGWHDKICKTQVIYK